MKYFFISAINQITKELGGQTIYPRINQEYDLILHFNFQGKEFIDYLSLKVFLKDEDCGIIVRSSITDKNYIPISTYTFLLVENLEEKLHSNISLKHFTAGFYFKGEKEFSKN